MNWAEAQAFLDSYAVNGPPPLPSVSDLSIDELKNEAQTACDTADWPRAKQCLIELYDRGYDKANMASNLGRVHADWLLPQDSVAWYRKALELDPTRRLDHEHIIYLRDSMPETTEAAEQDERRAYFETCGRPFYNKRIPLSVDCDPERPLRVGYVSGDWNFHSAAIAFSPALLNHSAQIVPHIYSTLHPAHYDRVTRETWIPAYKDRFYEVYGLTPKQLAAVIRDDQIDILVDLAGYTHKNRIQTFACRPAPIQIQAWGYVLDTNSPAIDYVFADPIVATDRLKASGRIVELPSILGFFPREELPEATPLPCLTEPPQFVVPQRSSKVNAATCRVWAEILRRVPDATLTFKAPNYFSRKRIEIADLMSNVRHQIRFVDGVGQPHHIREYSQFDLSLDPWPQTGGVSSLEALWMGVPIVTLWGERMITRTTASFLTNCGMQDLIAYSEQEYIDKAVALVTTDRDRLATWRATARERLRASPIMAGYAEAVDAAYRKLWRDYCAKASERAA